MLPYDSIMGITWGQSKVNTDYIGIQAENYPKWISSHFIVIFIWGKRHCWLCDRKWSNMNNIHMWILWDLWKCFLRVRWAGNKKWRPCHLLDIFVKWQFLWMDNFWRNLKLVVNFCAVILFCSLKLDGALLFYGKCFSSWKSKKKLLLMLHMEYIPLNIQFYS